MELLSLNNLLKYLQSCLRLEGRLKTDVRTTSKGNKVKKANERSPLHVLPHRPVCFLNQYKDINLRGTFDDGLRE